MIFEKKISWLEKNEIIWRFDEELLFVVLCIPKNWILPSFWINGLKQLGSQARWPSYDDWPSPWFFSGIWYAFNVCLFSHGQGMPVIVECDRLSFSKLSMFCRRRSRGYFLAWLNNRRRYRKEGFFHDRMSYWEDSFSLFLDPFCSER